MILYLIRHAKDDDSIRGGWSHHSLTEEGRQQARLLAEFIKKQENNFEIKKIYSSDLPRAMETAAEISKLLKLPIRPTPEFREVNNGDLAGMKHEIAAEKYPDRYWNLMDWTQAYPNGESPKAFYERISSAWFEFSVSLSQHNENCILVTHGGVLQVITSIVNSTPYSNQYSTRRFKPCEIIPLTFEGSSWAEIK